MAFGNGITVTSSFDLGAALPVDSKLVAQNQAERDAHITGNRAYEGMIVYVVEDKKTYQLTVLGSDVESSTWEEFGSSVSGDVQAELDKKLDKAGGDAKDTVVTFTEAAERAPIASGETMAVIMGKLMKTQSDLGEIAYKDTISASDIEGSVETANKLTSPFNISATGDVTISATPVDGSSDVSLTTVLANSGVSAGTYTKLTVNEKGIVTSAEQIAASDIGDLGTSANKDVGTEEGNIPVLGPEGKLDQAVLPSIAINNTFVVESEEAMLGLTAEIGDIAVRTDVSKSFILAAEGASTIGNWQELLTPADTVQSVNGKTGVVVLTTSDVTEGTNLYYTEERATQNFNTNIAKTASTALSDSNDIMRYTDEITLDGSLE